jgi:hypothetical protein
LIIPASSYPEIFWEQIGEPETRWSICVSAGTCKWGLLDRSPWTPPQQPKMKKSAPIQMHKPNFFIILHSFYKMGRRPAANAHHHQATASEA